MKFFISLLLLLLFFAIALFIGFVAGVIAATQMKSTQEEQNDER